MRQVEGARHRVLFRDPHAYCAHPHAVALPGGDWLMVFNKAPRRAVILHPPEEPEFRNLLCRSSDDGETWSTPCVVPDYSYSGMECAGLTAVRDGRVLLNQWRFTWVPLPAAEGRDDLTMPERLAAGLIASPEHAIDTLADARALMPWARAQGDAFVHLSDDGGRRWHRTVRLGTAPFEGGYGMRGALELPDGDLLLPLADVPAYRRIYVLRSSDRGESWGPPVTVADIPGKEFEEPAPLLLPDGRIVMLLRENRSRRLHLVRSGDGGRSWSTPAPTAIDGYPAHLLLLDDGRVLCTIGWREPPYGIRVVLFENGPDIGAGDAITIRDDLPNRDLGYPCTLEAADGSLVTFYYAQDQDGVTAIMSSRYTL
ncbi:MAG: sialidase family protein [Alphaproteobacteria bacterium]